MPPKVGKSSTSLGDLQVPNHPIGTGSVARGTNSLRNRIKPFPVACAATVLSQSTGPSAENEAEVAARRAVYQQRKKELRQQIQEDIAREHRRESLAKCFCAAFLGIVFLTLAVAVAYYVYTTHISVASADHDDFEILRRIHRQRG